MNKKIVSRLLVVMTLVVIGMTAACMPAAATTISIDDASADSGATTSTPIHITDLTEILGAVEIVLTYGEDAEVVSVSDGTMGAVTSGINNVAHTTTITWFSATGVTGDQTFAEVELRAVGDPGEESPLDLTVNELVSTGGTPIAHVVGGGWFDIIGGDITITDAVIALKIAASGGYNEDADLNGDHKVTSLDALMILQKACGKGC